MSLQSKIDGTDITIGDAVVVTSDPLNQLVSVRYYIRGKGGIVEDIDPENDDLTIVFGGNVKVEVIWFKRVRKATPEEARVIQLIHDVHRRV